MNQRVRLKKIAKRHGVNVHSVQSWDDLRDRLVVFANWNSGGSLSARKFCFVFMEEHGWIPPRRKKQRTD